MTQPTWRNLFLILGAGACTASEPLVVASNCQEGETCVKSQALKLEAVDILLVVDDSPSIAYQAAELKDQLPRMLTAITRGGEGDTSFPAIESVHVAVTTTAMDLSDDSVFSCRPGHTHDAMFVKPGEVGVTCDVSYPGYLSFEGGRAAVATADSVACVPLVFADENKAGCGFEQPLETALRSLWPEEDARVSFANGQGHGSGENSGFLRPNSLLVVVVVTDEDDCSAEDWSLYKGGAESFETLGPVNLRCFNHADKLYPVERYVQNLKQLRPNNDNVVFAVIGGIPPELVTADYRAGFALDTSEGVTAYYDSVLGHELMQEVAESADDIFGALRPSCSLTRNVDVDMDGVLEMDDAMPPRRLVEVAKGFGPNSVIGSICTRDFGETTGQIIRAIGDRLINAS